MKQRAVGSRQIEREESIGGVSVDSAARIDQAIRGRKVPGRLEEV
jgi:hypothetical protein